MEVFIIESKNNGVLFAPSIPYSLISKKDKDCITNAFQTRVKEVHLPPLTLLKEIIEEMDNRKMVEKTMGFRFSLALQTLSLIELLSSSEISRSEVNSYRKVKKVTKKEASDNNVKFRIWVERYLPAYQGCEEVLYSQFRNGLAHQLVINKLSLITPISKLNEVAPNQQINIDPVLLFDDGCNALPDYYQRISNGSYVVFKAFFISTYGKWLQ